MDRVFVGQLINEVAMGAVSVSYPFTLINTSVGSASVLSSAIGKKDQDTVDKIMGNLREKSVSGQEWGDPHGYELCIDASMGETLCNNRECPTAGQQAGRSVFRRSHAPALW